MFEEVKGKPVRGILSNVSFMRERGNLTGILTSPDFCEGQEGRNHLTQGRNIHTSTIQAIDVVEGQLVVVTRNSAYVIEGSIAIWEEVMKEVFSSEDRDVPTDDSEEHF